MREKRTLRIVRAGLFILPVLILLLHLNDFPYPPGADFTDLAISHYPNLLFLQRSLQSGVIPLWSPSILSGTPFAANPLSGLWYPPGWAALLFPLPAGILLLLAAHIVWAGVGMYRLLKSEGLDDGGALFGALAFEAMPKMFSHLAAGHVTLLFAVAWTPWLLYAERSKNTGWRGRRLLPGIVLGLIALADPRWAAYSGLLWITYSLLFIWRTSRSHLMGSKDHKGAIIGDLTRLPINASAALIVASPLLLPLIEYTSLSGRSAMTVEDSLALSLPPRQLFGLVYPYIAGMAEWVVYPGGAVLALALLAVIIPAVRRAAGFWIGLVIFCVVVAMGSYMPAAEWIWQLPGLNLLRVPARAIFLAGMGMAAAAGAGFQELLGWQLNERSQRQNKQKARAVGPVLFACALFVGFFGAAAWLMVSDDLARIRFAWGAVFFPLSAGFILLVKADKVKPRAAFTTLAALVLVDICGVNVLSVDFRPARLEVFSQPKTPAEQTAAFLLDREARVGGEIFRTYSPSYSIPQDMAMEYGLELADGVDPLRLEAYDHFMERASGVPLTGYSVTLPPFASGNPKIDNLDYLPDPKILGLLNVKYVTADFPLVVDGLSELAQFEETYVYLNNAALPRAWVQRSDAPVGEEANDVQNILVSPNSIVIQANGPGMLVLSEVVYPGWRARIDGYAAPVKKVGGLLRAVELNEGEHKVVFEFRPGLVYAGAALAGLFWLSFAASYFFYRRYLVGGNG